MLRKFVDRKDHHYFVSQLSCRKKVIKCPRGAMTWRGLDGRFGLIICFCPTSAEVIAAMMGCDLAVVWRDFNAQ